MNNPNPNEKSPTYSKWRNEGMFPSLTPSVLGAELSMGSLKAPLNYDLNHGNINKLLKYSFQLYSYLLIPNERARLA